MVGSLTGVVASKRVTEAFKGTLSTLGNRAQSAIAKGCLTVRLTSRAGTKVGLSDLRVPSGRARNHRIKATPGITGLSRPSVHSDGVVWHLKLGCGDGNIIKRNRLITVDPDRSRERGQHRGKSVEDIFGMTL